MNTPKTWILIADGGHARVLETLGIGNPLIAADGWPIHKDLPPNRDIESDRPARTQESVGAARHAVPAGDPHRELKRSFAHDIADRLEASLAANAFGRLIVVAPPTTLGDLRQALSNAVAATVAAEVAKDLVKVPNPEVRSHLTDLTMI